MSTKIIKSYKVSGFKFKISDLQIVLCELCDNNFYWYFATFASKPIKYLTMKQAMPVIIIEIQI